MEGIIVFAVWGLFGWVCYNIAKSKNRNSELWAVFGILFGIFAVITISVLPNIPIG